MLQTRQYQLLDFGEGRRLEQFAGLVVDRPCPTAEGMALASPSLWRTAGMRFERNESADGEWIGSQPPTDSWTVSHGRVTFELSPTPQGQVGLFPEQADNWDWIFAQGELAAKTGTTLQVLNLFAYTGGSTLAAAAAGAEVVHVDAAKNVVAWARRNASLSGLDSCPIRWITEDASKFVRRECKRGNRYDAIILDPPSYGHGRRGEVWQLSKHLPGMLQDCAELTNGRPRFLLLTCHTPGFGPERLAELLRDTFGNTAATATAQPLTLTTASGRQLPAGASVRWQGWSGTARRA